MPAWRADCCVNDFTQAVFLCERFHTSRGFYLCNRPFRDGHHIGGSRAPSCSHSRARGFPPGPTRGGSIMMAMITVALFAVVLALPGLMAVLMSREIDSEQNAR